MVKALVLALLLSPVCRAQILLPAIGGAPASPLAPQFVQVCYATTGGTQATTKSCTLTGVIASHILVTFCYAGSGSALPITMTIGSNSFTTLTAPDNGGDSSGKMGVAFNVGAGITTGTCTVSTNANLSIVMAEYTGRSTSSLDTQARTTGPPSSATLVCPNTGGFTTTGPDTIVFAVAPHFNNSALPFTAGLIAGSTASIRGVPVQSIVLEDVTKNLAVTSQTASVTASASDFYWGNVAALKY